MTTVPAAGEHPAPPEHPERPTAAVGSGAIPSWPAWSAPAALFAGFAAAVVVYALIAGVAAVFGVDSGAPGIGIIATVGQDLCLIGSALLFARMAVGPSPTPGQFGLRRAPLKRSALYVIGAYVAFVVASIVWLAIIGETNAKDTITQDLGAKDSTLALIAVTFLVCVCAPLAEEFFFRGYFFGALRSLGFWPAALLTGLTFGLVHVAGSPAAFLVPLAAFGTTLCFIREKTGSLYPGIALHCINNSVAMRSSENWTWQLAVVLVLAPVCIALLVRLLLRFWPPPRPVPVTAGAPTA